MSTLTLSHDTAGLADHERIDLALHYLERNRERCVPLAEVADVVGLSPFHFQRMFTRWTGISPKRFAQYLTLDDARALLRMDASLLEAACRLGLSGTSRLHDLFVTFEAVTPGEYKAGGAGLSIDVGEHDTPFGRCLLGLSPRGVCWLSFVHAMGEEGTLAGGHEGTRARRHGGGEGEQGTGNREQGDGERHEGTEARRHEGKGRDAGRGRRQRVALPGIAPAALAELRRAWPAADIRTNPDATARVVEQIFANRTGRTNVRVLTGGTNFQIKVWEALIRIPPGGLATYSDIAADIGMPRAARAVGNACGANRVAWLIPCHRVIRSMGLIGNYGGGVERKQAMIAWEAARYANAE